MKKIDEEYVEKLRRMGREFQKAYYTEQWGKAKRLHSVALNAAEFLEIPEELQMELFGTGREIGETEEVPECVFSMKMCNKVYHECVIKLYQSYENESYRRFGQPPLYYPYPRYPVPGLPKPEKEKC